MNKKQLGDLVNKIHSLPGFLVVAVPFGSAAVIFGSYRGHSLAVLWGKEDDPNVEAHTFMQGAEASGCSVLACVTFNQAVAAVQAIATAVNARYAMIEKEKTWNLMNNGNNTGH